MMNRFYFLCVLNCALSGCGQSAPSGFPAVVPTKITVLKGGKPLADVSVYCDAPPSQAYVIGGQTDANGIADMRTMQAAYQKNGVPAGTYNVRLSEMIPPFPNAASDEEIMNFTAAEQINYDKKRMDYEKSNRKIPEKYAGSPAVLRVGASACELEIDVEK